MTYSFKTVLLSSLLSLSQMILHNGFENEHHFLIFILQAQYSFMRERHRGLDETGCGA